MERCESAWANDITYVVELTGLLNEGRAVNDGTWESGTANWRFKHDRVFVVKDCKTAQDAVAFVVALGLENSMVLKEWPSKVMAWDQWYADLVHQEQELVADGYADAKGKTEYEAGKARYVSPKDVKASKAEMAAKVAKYGM
tara:strand:- start:557 stop:982 length:426 start_codon:yes stop_codon:yes gene_type:complete